MADSNELVIKINGDVKNFTAALEAVEKRTEDLSDALSTTAKTAAVAFAALTAEVGFSVKAFKESQAATDALTQALQNQGIYSKELVDSYQEQATMLQQLTGVSDEAVIGAQTTIQAYLGQTAVTEDLTMAIADLAAGKHMDLQATAELIGKGINGHAAALGKLGIEIDDSMSKQNKLAQVIEKVTEKYGGQAEASSKAIAPLARLKETFGDLQEEIGKRFAPLIDSIATSINNFLQKIKSNKALVDFTVSIIAAGIGVSGVVGVVATLGLGFLKLKSALEAAKIATSAMQIATKGLVAATGLGLLLVLISEIYMNWSSVWPRMQAIFVGFVNNIVPMLKGFGTLLVGVLAGDLDLIKEGWAKTKEAFKNFGNEYNAVLMQKKTEQANIEAEAEKKLTDQNDANAKKREQKNVEQQRRETEALKAEKELRFLQQEEASSKLLELKKKEVEDLKLLADEKFKGDKDALIERAEELRALEEEQAQIDADQKAAYQEEILATNAEYQAMTDEQQALFDEQNGQKLQEQVMTQKTIKAQMAQDSLALQIQNNNKFLQEQQKFGTAYATISKMMHSEIYNGSKQAFGELAQLTQSSNSTLKGIGKAAAVANIIIKTAESAMSIYAGFSTIPIIGPALGVAGAAAAIAFGGEQVGRVTAAANGGLLTGGIAGVDSIPVLAQRNELISPSQSFEEVIGSVRAAREAEKIGSRMGDPTTQSTGGFANIMIGFDGKEASQVLTVRQIEDRALGVSQSS